MEGRRSGVEEYTESILKNLFVIDPHNEYVLFLNSFRRPNIDLSWVEEFPHVSIKRFHYPNKLFNLALWYVRFPKIDKMLGGIDLFFAPNITFLSLSKGVKFVLTVHDLSFELYPETFTLKRRLWHTFIHPRILAKSADHIIAVSRSTAEDLSRYYGTQESLVTVIPSGVGDMYVEMDRNDPKMLEVQKKYALPYRYILFLGTLEPRKNITALIQAYNALRKRQSKEIAVYTLVIAGSSGWNSNSITEEIRKSPYKKDIRHIGFVDEKDKPAMYNLASVFVYPSLYEGFGFPALEAMRCATPTIISHSSSLGEMAESAAILIDPYKPEQITQALEELIRDKAFAQKMGKAGQRRAYVYRWQLSAHQTLEVFRSTLGDK